MDLTNNTENGSIANSQQKSFNSDIMSLISNTVVGAETDYLNDETTFGNKTVGLETLLGFDDKLTQTLLESLGGDSTINDDYASLLEINEENAYNNVPVGGVLGLMAEADNLKADDLSIFKDEILSDESALAGKDLSNNYLLTICIALFSVFAVVSLVAGFLHWRSKKNRSLNSDAPAARRVIYHQAPTKDQSIAEAEV